MSFNRKTDNWLNTISGIQEGLQNRKSVQPVGGDLFISYKTSSGSINDYSFTLTNSVPLRYFRLEFDHQNSAHGALLSLKVFTSVDVADVMPNATPYFVSVAPPALVRWKKDLSYSTDTKTVWTIVVAKGQMGVTSFGIYWKFFIDGTDTGTWSVTAL